MSNGLFFKASLPFSVPSLVSTSECCPVIKLPRESIKILVTILHDNILEGDLFSVDIAYNLWIYTQQNKNILNRVSNIIRFERVPGSKCQMAPPQGQKLMRLKKYAKNIFSMLNKMLVVHSFRHMHNAYVCVFILFSKIPKTKHFLETNKVLSVSLIMLFSTNPN